MTTYIVERDRRETLEIKADEFDLDGVGNLTLRRDGKAVAVIHPQEWACIREKEL